MSGYAGVSSKRAAGMIFKSFGVKYFVITQIDLLEQRKKWLTMTGALGGIIKRGRHDF